MWKRIHNGPVAARGDATVEGKWLLGPARPWLPLKSLPYESVAMMIRSSLAHWFVEKKKLAWWENSLKNLNTMSRAWSVSVMRYL